jgi:hypothetical protein
MGSDASVDCRAKEERSMESLGRVVAAFAATFCLVFLADSVSAADVDAGCKTQRNSLDRAEERKDAAERASDEAELAMVKAQANLDICISAKGDAVCHTLATVRDAERSLAAHEKERAERRARYLREVEEKLVACDQKQTGGR